MPDVQANIILQTTGGDASAAEINKAAHAIGNVTSSSSALQEKFQERFQHIGLQLFAGQALQSIGLSGETRQAVMLMNTALTAAQDAAGISSGGLTLLLTALVAVAAAVYKVVEAHKSHIEELQKLHQATQDQITSVNNDIESINKYLLAGGDASKTNTNWLHASEALRDALIKQQEITDIQTISVLKATIAQEELALATTKSISVNDLKYLSNTSAATASAANQMKLLASQVDKLTLALDKDKANLAATAAEMDRLKQHGGQTMQQLVQDAQKSADEREKILKAEFDNEAKMWDDYSKARQKNIDDMVKAWEAGSKVIAKDLSTAFYDMLAQGQSFTDAMMKMFEKMFEQILQQILTLIAEWAIFSAMTGMGGGSVAAAGLSGLKGMNFAGMNLGLGAQATGGSYFADTPTLAMFGESGPEMATFSPMSGGGTSSSMGGGGGSTQVNNISINIQGVVDQALVNQIGQKIVQTIRGQGQIAFA